MIRCECDRIKLVNVLFCDRISAEAEAFGHALRSRSVGFAETLHRIAWQ
ncbi:MAG: hypothetical protein F6J98_24405 [Moorea sp. SIO4G2]|nr:hypothetical protein [Moorena sp. SIO4G2]